MTTQVYICRLHNLWSKIIKKQHLWVWWLHRCIFADLIIYGARWFCPIPRCCTYLDCCKTAFTVGATNAASPKPVMASATTVSHKCLQNCDEESNFNKIIPWLWKKIGTYFVSIMSAGPTRKYPRPSTKHPIIIRSRGHYKKKSVITDGAIITIM